MDNMLCLFPPILAIGLAICTKRVLFSLFFASWLGATLLQMNPFVGFLDVVDKYMLSAISDRDNVTILIYGVSFGGFMLLLQKTGGILAIGDFLARTMKTPYKAQMSAFGMGLLVFLDDYFSCLTVGNVLRPIFDRLKICREKLAFLVDVTAAPVCLLVPISTWVVYVVGLIRNELLSQGISKEMADVSFGTYICTIPINFYAISALLGTAVLLVGKFSFGPMHTAEDRCAKTGMLSRQDATLPSEQDFGEFVTTSDKQTELKFFFLPFAMLFAMVIFMFLYTGKYWETEGCTIMDALRSAKSGISILVGVLVSSGLAIILGCWRGHFSLMSGTKHYVTGMRSMFTTILILVAAWTMSRVTKDLGTAKYLSKIIQQLISPEFLPFLIFIFGCFMSFFTGTSYGTFALLIPLAIPLSKQMGIPLEYSIAAVLSGGVFGDHCSPISDTTILSSSSSICDLTDHAQTQIPYALWFAGSAGMGFLMLPTFGFWGAWISVLVFGTILLFGLKRWQPTYEM